MASMNTKNFLLPLSLLLFAAFGAKADEYDIPPTVVERFAREFQDALSKRDVQRVASMVRFPLRVNTEGGGSLRLRKGQLLKTFDQVFPEAVVKEVLAQDPMQLFHNYQGVMFGSGAVWAGEFCGRKQRPDCPVLVTTVNRPAK